MTTQFLRLSEGAIAYEEQGSGPLGDPAYPRWATCAASTASWRPVWRKRVTAW